MNLQKGVGDVLATSQNGTLAYDLVDVFAGKFTKFQRLNVTNCVHMQLLHR